MEPRPSEAAIALADTLVARAEALDSTNLDDIVAAIPAIRAAARRLGELLKERGWGEDILYGWPGPLDEDEDEDAPGQVDEELDEYDEDAEVPPMNAARVTYQARFDFVVVDEEALRARAEARSRQVNPDVDPTEGMQEYGGPLSLLLYLDNPTFRDYEEAGVAIAYGNEVLRPVARTLDEYDYDTQDDHFPTD